MSKAQLEIGDELVVQRYSFVDAIIKIDRVTAKRAYAGSTEFERDVINPGPQWSAKARGVDTWGQHTYRQPTERDRIDMMAKAVANLSSFDRLRKLSMAQLSDIYEAISKPTHLVSTSTTTP